MKRCVVAGSRGSALALKQTQWVLDFLEKRAADDVEFRVEIIKTTGDKMLSSPFTQIVGKGFFTKEIEEALLAGKIDFAVHSLKDLPTQIPAGLALGAIPRREDPRDALVARGGQKLAELPRAARVGTSSPRRHVQLLATRPDLEVVPLRGNLSTRLKKVLQPEVAEMDAPFDAAVVALAGVRRMGLESQVTQILPYEVMLPAVGQGFLGIEAREGDQLTLDLLLPLEDADSRWAATAERAFLEAWGGGCAVPLGALAQVRAGELHLQGVVFDEKKKGLTRAEVCGKKEEAFNLGKKLAERIRK